MHAHLASFAPSAPCARALLIVEARPWRRTGEVTGDDPCAWRPV